MTESPWTWIAIASAALAALVVVLAVLAVLMVRRRRRRGRGQHAEPRGTPLVRTWRQFCRHVPGHVSNYPVAVVLGSAGAGKSQLVDRWVDWRGQAHALLPSNTSAGDLQVYMGSGLVVKELSGKLLCDASLATGRQLRRLWRSVRSRVQIVVIALSATELLRASPEELHLQAQLFRGKLRLLCKGRTWPTIRLCLTHMDRLGGWEMVHSLGDAGADGWIPMSPDQLDVDAAVLEAALAASVPHALTHGNSDEFARMIEFIARAPAIAGRLGPFLRGLQGDDPLTRGYSVAGLYLHGHGSSARLGNPFQVSRRVAVERWKRGRKRHHALALTGLLVASLAAVTLQVEHQQAVAAAGQAVTALDGDEASSNAWLGAAERVEDVLGESRAWLGWSYGGRKEALGHDFVSALRREWIAPRLTGEADVYRRVYLASLLLATRDSQLGALITEHATLWAQAVDLPEPVIRVYLRLADRPPADDEPTLRDLDGAEESVGAWQGFAVRVARALDKRTLSAADLAELEDAAPRTASDGEYELLSRALEAMRAQPSLPREFADVLALEQRLAWFARHRSSVEVLAEAVRTELPAADTLTLNGLLDYLEEEHARRVPSQAVTLEVDAKAVTLDVGAACKRLRQVRASLVITAFVQSVNRSRRSPFFSEDDTYPDITLSTSSEPGAEHHIRGMYSRQALSDRVAVAVQGFEERLNALELGDDADRAALTILARRGIREYAEGYATELRAFYKGVVADHARRSRGQSGGRLDGAELANELRTLARPESWFVEFLGILASQAQVTGIVPAVAAGDASTQGLATDLALLQGAVADFVPLIALVAEPDKGYPGLEPYRALLAELANQLDLAGQAPLPAKNLALPAEVQAYLSPAGRVYLAAITSQDPGPIALLHDWLARLPLDPSLWQIFTSLPEVVEQEGSKDGKDAMGRWWDERFAPELEPVLGRFPLRSSADTEISVDELERVLLPGKGIFWQRFAVFLAPLLVKGPDGYRARDGVSSPRQIVALVNRLDALQEMLWRDDGSRKPFTLRVTPLPLPASKREWVVTSAVLLAAGHTIEAFNQKPRPYPLEVPWWQQQTSELRIEAVKSDGSGTRRQTLARSDSTWSILRLLQEAEITPSGVASWKTGDGGAVSFELHGDAMRLVATPDSKP